MRGNAADNLRCAVPLKLYMMSVVGAYVGLFFEDMTGSWGMLFVGMAGELTSKLCTISWLKLA